MTPKTEYRCSACQTLIQGASRLCVSCFRERHKPCPRCMVRRPGGRFEPKNEDADCDRCHNERWILEEPKT
jgi:hypothetical protein